MKFEEKNNTEIIYSDKSTGLVVDSAVNERIKDDITLEIELCPSGTFIEEN